MPVLSGEEVERFVADGFEHLEGAFDRETAAACVDELWAASGIDRHDRSAWTSPVLRVAGSRSAPFVAAINTDRLCGAIDDLVGPGRWQRRTGYGTFPIRFPSEADPGDAGWHMDGSYRLDDEPPPWNLGLNLWSKGRALLLLMLFSDVGDDDVPTRIRVGSHRDVTAALVPLGERGANFGEVTRRSHAFMDRPVAYATGRAGDVYLCHPFLVHAASWPHRGTSPRFIGQPCIHHHESMDRFEYGRIEGEHSACERAVLLALEQAGVDMPAEGR
ncbi:MAG: phytanoyl-CoA dioxygenase [Acidimicrobiales bacterium]